MQVYRGKHPGRTDLKLPKDYVQGWKRQRGVWLDGTVTGWKRRTRFWVGLEDADVEALFYALIESCPNERALRVCPRAISRLATRMQEAVEQDLSLIHISEPTRP